MEIENILFRRCFTLYFPDEIYHVVKICVLKFHRVSIQYGPMTMFGTCNCYLRQEKRHRSSRGETQQTLYIVPIRLVHAATNRGLKLMRGVNHQRPSRTFGARNVFRSRGPSPWEFVIPKWEIFNRPVALHTHRNRRNKINAKNFLSTSPEMIDVKRICAVIVITVIYK